jgi:pimeloyl-ACP methyl ester carboxylesterase
VGKVGLCCSCTPERGWRPSGPGSICSQNAIASSRHSHPGYGNSPLIDGGAGGVDDLAYLYLDLAAELGLEDAVLVGADLGGWIAAEMMVRSTARFSCLVLVAPLGIKLRGRDERDIADMHGIERAEYLRLAWAEPAKGEADYTALPDTELAAIVRGREAFALCGG